MAVSSEPTIDARSWGGLGALGLAWGSSFLFVAFALEALDPFFVTGARLILAALLMGVLARVVVGPYPAEARFWIWSFPIGFFALFGAYLGYTWAQQRIPGAVAAIYVASGPLMVLILAHFLVGERLTRRRALGCAVGLFGVVLVIGPATLLNLGAAATLAYEAAALGSAVSFAIAIILVRKAPVYHPLHAAAGAVIAAALMATPLVIATWPDETPPAGPIIAVVILGLLQTGVAQIIRFWLIKRSGAVFASQASYLLPIVALCLGWVVLGERLTPLDAAGLLCILSGLAIGQVRRRRA